VELTGSYEPIDNGRTRGSQDSRCDHMHHTSSPPKLARYFVIAAACFTGVVLVANGLGEASTARTGLGRPAGVDSMDEALLLTNTESDESNKVGVTLASAMDQALRNAAADSKDDDTTTPPIPENMCRGFTEVKYFSKKDCVNDPSLSGTIISEPGKRTTELGKALDEALLSALREENCGAALQSEENARLVASKLSKLADESVFTFFRGAAGLFDDDMICYDDDFAAKLKDMPRVISNGDCHPENFGVMVSEDTHATYMLYAPMLLGW
jgi:hypothetical protein